MFINPNDFKKIAESMTEITDRIITPKQIEDLQEPTRKYLLSLRYQWTQGKDVITEIKNILRINQYLDKKETFLKIKFNN